MAITINCPNCQTSYSLADSVAGKKVRCKKCEEIFSVQRADEDNPDNSGQRITAGPKPRAVRRAVAEEEAAPKARRSRRAADDEDEPPLLQEVEEDEEADERPRKKKRKKWKPRISILAIILYGFGGLVALQVLGAIFWLVRGVPNRPAAPAPSSNTNPLVSNPAPQAGPFIPVAVNPLGVNPQPAPADAQPASGVVTQAEALAFNEKFASTSKRLSPAVQQFGQALQAALAQGGRNTQAVRLQQQAVQNSIASLRTEVQSWNVPNSTSAKALHQSYLRFLKGQDEAMQKFGDVITILENAALSTSQKRLKMQQILRPLEMAEQTQLAELQRLQREFAREYKIILVPG